MYFSKVVKKCNTGSTVYNSIDYFQNGYSVLFSPLAFFPIHTQKKSIPCLYRSEKSRTVMLTFMKMVYEKCGIHKSRGNYHECDNFFG